MKEYRNHLHLVKWYRNHQIFSGEFTYNEFFNKIYNLLCSIPVCLFFDCLMCCMYVCMYVCLYFFYCVNYVYITRCMRVCYVLFVFIIFYCENDDFITKRNSHFMHMLHTTIFKRTCYISTMFLEIYFFFCCSYQIHRNNRCSTPKK